MNHQFKRHRTIDRLKKRFGDTFGYVAAAIAGATILSGAMLPGIPAATAHASPATPKANTPITVSQQVTKSHKSGAPIRVNLKEGTAQVTVPHHKKNVNRGVRQTQPKTNTTKTSAKTEATKTEASKTEASKTEASKTEASKTEASKGAPENFKQELDITATAYAPGPHDNDQWGDKTYTGEQIRPGIIAVDPNIIPLGSRVYIQYPDGHGEYAVAADTGGAIKGNRIDVAKWSVGEAQDFGVQHVKVFVVDTPKNA